MEQTMIAGTNGKMALPVHDVPIGSSITTVEILCTPAMAEKFLKRNNKNRNLTASRVAHLVRQILDGHWVLTHQGIAFWDDGTLADGQHRLTAIAKAGVAVPILVTTGLPKPAIHAIDGGKPRSTTDIMHFVGIDVSTNVVAAARVLYMQREMARVDGTSWPAQTIATETLQRFISFVMPALEFGAITTSAKGLSHSCLQAAIASAWFTEDREKLARFKHLVTVGLDAAQHESAAMRLRDYLMTTPLTRGGGTARHEIFQRCCTALRAFLEGRGLTKLYCRPDAVFPIPDEE
jgi:hypothetical protein